MSVEPVIPDQSFLDGIPDGLTDEQREWWERAEQQRRSFFALINGSALRLEHLKRTHLSDLGFGVADLMLMQIITGRLVPRSAKEAMEVAKSAAELARREIGEPDATISISTPEQRANAIAKLAELGAAVRARAALDTGPPIEPVIDAESHDTLPRDELEVLVSSTQSATGRRALATVRAANRTPAKETNE